MTEPAHFTQINAAKLTPQAIDTFLRALPESDYINQQYDAVSELSKPTRITVLLSTERSGSTFASEWLYQRSGIVMHEYFQPFDYLPITATRWAASDGNRVHIDTYLRKLSNNRCSPQGHLAVNIHGSHLPLWRLALTQWQDVPIHYVHLRRQNTIAQAISLEIASQSGAWSSDFAIRQTEPEYRFEALVDRCNRLFLERLKLEGFCHSQQITPQQVWFETMVSAPDEVLMDAFGVTESELRAPQPNRLKRQRSPLNAQWEQRFLNDLEQLDTTRLGSVFNQPHIPEQLTLWQRGLRKLRRIVK